MICVVYAMEKEAKPFLDRNDVVTIKSFRSGFATIYECKANGRDVVVCVSGIGKVFASSAITSLANLYKNIEAVINAGVGGSNDKNIANIFDCVISSVLYQHDLDTTPIGDPMGFISGINIVSIPSSKKVQSILEKAAKKSNIKSSLAPMSSGDQFIHTKEQKDNIKKYFDSVSYDMESASMAQIAYSFSLPFAALRVITDCEDSANEYSKNLQKATELLSDIIYNVFVD